MDYSGKIIRKNPVTPSQTSASGVWTLDEALQAQRSNTWPVANVPDPISRSLRFRSSASAFLNRTPATTSSQTTCTWSGWIKRTPNYTTTCLSATNGNGSSNNDETWFIIGSDNVASIVNYVAGAFQANVSTPAVFRDPSAWYHVVFVWNTTSATSTDRCIIYVNGVRQTLTFTTTPSQNNTSWFNTGNLHRIGAPSRNAQAFGNNYYDGYMTEVNFIDGQALTPSSFGGTNAATGVWEPRPYTGTYGTNGFLLTFSDITSTATLGNDTSGNSNNWTTNNFSLTAGATYDSMIDVPTQWIGYNTGDVASVTRGNYCTLNPLSSTNVTLSNANLTVATTVSGTSNSFGTMGMPNTGKWYWEYVGTSDGREAFCGISNSARTGNVLYYGGTGAKLVNNVETSYGATYTNNDVIGVAVDVDTGNVTFYKNNVSQGAISNTLTNDTFFPFFADGSSSAGSTIQVNFGQRPFSYTPPAGFVSLCTTNLPSPTILQGGQFFNPVLYTGTGSTQAITGVGFQPDFTWVKTRSSGVYGHALFDAVRGLPRRLASNLTEAENTTGSFGQVSAFSSNGFTVAPGTDDFGETGANGLTYVAWNWNAGGSTVTNTAGSISSQVRASATSGFSIVTYTGTGANATVGHGLGVAPSMVIVKCRNTAGRSWAVYHASLGAANYLALNQTAASAAESTVWNNTAPTSTVFSIGTNTWTGANTNTYVAYCFAAVPGYSAFGSYTGNGSTDGPFVYLGFRPKFIMWKKTNTSTDAPWVIADTSRSPNNVVTSYLLPNSSDAEANFTLIDILSNGYKWRSFAAGGNANGDSYIYYAVAENPFKNALAR